MRYPQSVWSVAAAVLTGWLLSACNGEPTNPGDTSVASELEVVSVRSLTTGTDYPLTVRRELDTIFISGKSARFTEFEPLTIPSYADVALDTIRIELRSNAAWASDRDKMSLTYENVTWYEVAGAATGGGDGYLAFTVTPFAGTVSRHIKMRQVVTSDSTVMYRFYLVHTGLKFEE